MLARRNAVDSRFFGATIGVNGAFGVAAWSVIQPIADSLLQTIALLAGRVSVTALIAGLAYFFLQQYRNGAQEARYFEDEISTLVGLKPAFIIAERDDNKSLENLVVWRLGKYERGVVAVPRYVAIIAECLLQGARPSSWVD